jgi:putative Ca2+/H+ antiporter (TMEM165/GDT1 family)
MLACGPGPRGAARAGFWKVAARSFAVLFVAEFGDLTQLATANLAARYHNPLSAGVGAVLGLWAVGALAITGGRQLLRVVPFYWITRTAAAVMIVLPQYASPASAATGAGRPCWCAAWSHEPTASTGKTVQMSTIL